MRLISVYIVLVVIGEFVAYGLGRAVERFSVPASMPVFLGCFFFVFWAAWKMAVKVT
ncbi:MAG: hypothetical protein ACK4UO_10900 [Pseudolabrys sp.]